MSPWQTASAAVPRGCRRLTRFAPSPRGRCQRRPRYGAKSRRRTCPRRPDDGQEDQADASDGLSKRTTAEAERRRDHCEVDGVRRCRRRGVCRVACGSGVFVVGGLGPRRGARRFEITRRHHSGESFRGSRRLRRAPCPAAETDRSDRGIDDAREVSCRNAQGGSWCSGRRGTLSAHGRRLRSGRSIPFFER